jgi:hypothetical protein
MRRAPSPSTLAFERVKESRAHVPFADVVRLRNGPPLSRGRRILKQNQTIPSFPRKRESIRCQNGTFVRFDSFAGKAIVGLRMREICACPSSRRRAGRPVNNPGQGGSGLFEVDRQAQERTVAGRLAVEQQHLGIVRRVDDAQIGR